MNACLCALALLLIAPNASAWGRPIDYSPNHPFAIGSRLVGRAGPYTMGGIGGQVRIRPHRLVSFELFQDNYFGDAGGALRHDHEVGGIAHFPMLGGTWWNVAPLLGACANLAVVESPQGGASVNDIQFGIHAGVGSELHVIDGFVLSAQLQAVGYMGHDLRVYRWSAEVGSELKFIATAQLVLGINYYF